MFYLKIESSKDINELHINFADGTSSIVSSDNDKKDKITAPVIKESTKQKPHQEKPRKQLNEYLNTDEDYTKDEVAKIALPIIPDKTSINIADELQNFDI